jgi:hypothetical protein
VGAGARRGPRPYVSGATARPTTQLPAPKGSPGGGAYAYRYRDREHVNESGHGGLPVGVVPAAVLGVSGHPAWWAAYITTTTNPVAAAAAYTSAQLA